MEPDRIQKLRVAAVSTILAGTLVLSASVLALTAGSALAQETTGVLGSPSATTTIDGKQLPPPPGKFGGVMKESVQDSKPYWQPQVVPPKGAPNILLILTDDQGFGVPSTFGGVIPTPALDRIANAGLRYTQFHTTSLCSPTRAALITGRNHHSVGFGVISEVSTGFPGYDSVIGVDNATIGTILRDNGYGTSWFGKNHNTPSYETSLAGPYDQWPTGMGFDYFYGFMGGETDQWTPNVVRGTTAIYPWVQNPKYNLITDLADDAVSYLKGLNAVAPDKPFFLYYAPGSAHAPHHPTPEWIAKFKGKFDMGWNVMREQIFANQKRLGLIPADTQLTAWPDSLAKWDTLDADSKKLFARQAEVFAAYVAYNDHEIGRVIQAVEDMGKLDNTIVIYISGDNGTSPEGSVLGSPFEMAPQSGIVMPVAEQLKYYDVWGSAATQPHMAVAWSWAFDTPFKWTKQIASFFGGTRNGVAISWPGHIKDAGGIRTQFHHVIDIVPTLLEATGIQAPAMVNGIAQKPIEGVSMAYTFDKANEKAPSARTTQYFEMFGNQAIYHDDWVAATVPPEPPWLMGLKKMPEPADYKWELYNINEDFSQNNDLAAKNPDKLAEMKKLFEAEAWKYNVFPLDNRTATRTLIPRPSPTAGRTVFTYSGEVFDIPLGSAPSTLGKSFTMTAEVEIPKDGAEGMLNTAGGRFGGYGLYLVKGKPVFTYVQLTTEKTRWEGSEALTPGKHTIVFDFKYDGPGYGKGGTGVLSVDGKVVSTKTMKDTIPFLISFDETFDVGRDTRTGVDDDDYRPPFRFTGQLDKLTLKLESLTAAEEKLQQEKIQEIKNKRE
jgi:arylsulfatase A-like enzyme